MKKYLLIVFTVLMLFVFDRNEVFAKINTQNTQIECIYGTGVATGLTYNQETNEYFAYVKEYPALSKTSSIDGDQITNISFYNVSEAANKLKALVCPETISYWVAYEQLTSDKNETKTFKGVYSYGNEASITTALKIDDKIGWWIFKDTIVERGVLTLSGTNLKKTGEYVKIPLVAERLTFIDDIGEDAYSHTYKLYVEGESQAIGSNKYAQMYKGDNGHTYLQIGKSVTQVGVMKTDYLCIKESVETDSTSNAEPGKRYSSIRHQIQSSTKSGVCPQGFQKYVRTTDVCEAEIGSTGESFCDKYSNTAFVIIDIIKIMQILVPAIVIVLTGIEIGKIVLAGNIEEELPKRKQSIIIRLIVMVAFFFLPTIVQLIISLAEGVSILDVSCLFNNGITEGNNALDDGNCVEADEE